MTERIGYPEYITNDTRLEGEYTNVSPNGMCIPLFSVMGSVMGQLLYCYGPHYPNGSSTYRWAKSEEVTFENGAHSSLNIVQSQLTPPRPPEISEKNWSTKAKPFLTSHV